MADYFTKYTMAEPVLDTTAKEAVRVVLKWFLVFGPPKRLMTDRGSNFTSVLLKEVCLRMGVDRTEIAPYHQQSNGQAERLVGTFSRLVRAQVEEGADWEGALPFVVYAYNCSVHRMTGEVPFVLWFGRLPSPMVESEPVSLTSGFDHKFADQREYAQYLYEQGVLAVERVRAAQDKLRSRMERDARTSILKKNFKVGDLVWVYVSAPPGKSEGDAKLGKFRRLWTQWKGPYFIKEVQGDNLLVAKGGASREKDKLIHHVRARRYLYPLRGLADEGVKREGYINQVIGHRSNRGQMQFQVVWVTPQGEKKEWVRQGIVPYSLVQRYFEVLKGMDKPSRVSWDTGAPEEFVVPGNSDPQYQLQRDFAPPRLEVERMPSGEEDEPLPQEDD
jgi:transposase InsO family protein